MIDIEFQKHLGPAITLFLTKDRDGLFPGQIALTNVLIHAINVLLLFRVLRRFTRAAWPSALAAGLLAIHPMHVESVAWISERKDVLCLMFLLLTLRAYHVYAQDRNWRSYMWVLTLFACSLMSKPMMVTLPAVLLLLDVWPLRRWRLRWFNAAPVQQSKGHLLAPVSPLSLVVEKLPFVAMSIGMALLTMFLQIYNETIADGIMMPLAERLEIVAVSYVRYLHHLIWPLDLSPLYPNPAQLGREFWSASQVAGSVALLLLITLAAIYFGRKRPFLVVGWFWFLGTLVPVIGFVQIGRHSLADRYVYIPYIGLYVAIAWLLGDLVARAPKARALVSGAAALLFIPLFALTYQQIQHWRTGETMFRRALETTEENWLIHSGMSIVLTSKAGELSRNGDVASADLVAKEALFHAEEAVRLNPETPWLRVNLAKVYDPMGRFVEAQEQLEIVLRQEPENAKAHMLMATVCARRRDQGRALYHGKTAVDLDPKSGQAHLTYAIVLSEFNQLKDALAALDQAFALDPEIMKLHAGTYAAIEEAWRSQNP